MTKFRLGVLLVIGAAFLIAAAPASAQRKVDVRLSAYPGGFKVSFVESEEACNFTEQPGRVVIRSGSFRAVTALPNICSKAGWKTTGRVPGGWSPSFVRYVGQVGSVISFVPNGDNMVRTFSVVAESAGRRATGSLAVEVERYWHRERIYEGRDAFVNYCIDRSQELRSLGGRLFCWRDSPVTGPDSVIFEQTS